MSLVRTRPPTVDEWDKYELHHRARLATKPGLTGMWQVSGQSNVTDLQNPKVKAEYDALQPKYDIIQTVIDVVFSIPLARHSLTIAVHCSQRALCVILSIT